MPLVHDVRELELPSGELQPTGPGITIATRVAAPFEPFGVKLTGETKGGLFAIWVWVGNQCHLANIPLRGGRFVERTIDCPLPVLPTNQELRIDISSRDPSQGVRRISAIVMGYDPPNQKKASC